MSLFRSITRLWTNSQCKAAHTHKVAFYSAVCDRPEDHHTPEIDLRLNSIRTALKDLGDGTVTLSLPNAVGDGNPKATDDTSRSPESVVQSNKIAMISISNPGGRNSLSGKMMCELADAVDVLQAWEGGAGVVLHGENGFFCAGADLKVAAQHMLGPSENGMGEEMSYLMHHTTSRLRALPLISVAAIEGAAVGGGAELATACDFRVMAKDSYIRFVHALLSVVPGWGGGTRLTKIVGRRDALRIVCTADKIHADQAMAFGLCDEVVETSTDTVKVATGFLQKLTANSTAATRALKTVVSQADDDAYRPSLNHEHDVFSRMWGNKASAEQIGKGGASARKGD